MTGNLLGDKASTVVFDNSKLKSVVPSFKAEMKYCDGVKLVVDNILKHEECQVADPEFGLWCDHVVAVMQEASRKIAAITV